MALNITKKCFPSPYRCFNCERKDHNSLKGKSEVYKRCSGCHLFTYCDQDCQREHWLKVHRYHCQYLGGKKSPEKHNPATCPLCLGHWRSTNRTDFSDMNSPKVPCHIGEQMEWVKCSIGKQFNLHEEGKTCDCPKPPSPLCPSCLPCELPFAPGEVTGDYFGDGLDEMIAHVTKLMFALKWKDKTGRVADEHHVIFHTLMKARASIWTDALILGMESNHIRFKNFDLDVPIEVMKNNFGKDNVWWRALKFSMDLIEHMTLLQKTAVDCDFADRRDDQRFATLKTIFDPVAYGHFANAAKKKMLSRFQVWPVVRGKEITLVLPDGVKCDGCGVNLRGKFSFFGEDAKDYPNWMPGIGENGSCLVYCGTRNKNCVSKFLSGNYFAAKLIRMSKEMDKYNEEFDLFMKLSRRCDVCHKRSLHTHRCTACLASQYCSTSCQTKDRDFHLTVCSKWSKDQKRKIGSAKDQRKVLKSVL